MSYGAYTLRRTSSRTVYAIYDDLGNQPVCKRDGAPFTTTDRSKATRTAAQMSRANDAAGIAVALIDFGATQSEAWRYAQTVYDLAR